MASSQYQDTNMRRRGSMADDVEQQQENGHANVRTHIVRRRHRKPRLYGKARMDASRRLVVLFLSGVAAVFIAIVLVSLVVTRKNKKPSNKNVDNVNLGHRDFRPTQRQFTRFTVDAPDCEMELDPMDVRYTLVTQLSVDRIWMMKQHCERWGSVSPISVAIFTNQSVPELTHELVDLGCNPETLTVQVVDSGLYDADDYPVNVLRNLALSAVTTSHVMYSDVDFWESENLHDILQEPDVRQVLAMDPKRALVVPAFQLNRQCTEWRDCRELNVPKMPKTKHDLVELVKTKQAFPFDPTNRGGHGSTLYATWFKQHAADVIDIPCVKSNRYEPYMVFRYCRDLPPFHPEFSGYGKNKMTMVMHMRHIGYQFSQLGGGFVIHYPHLDSSSRMEWNEKPNELLPYKDSKGKWHQKRPKDVHGVDWSRYKRGQVDEMFVEFRQWLTTQVPDEARVPKCDNFNDDDAKLWISREENEEE